jgi:glycosyltransferase involved in cell wall biosynthesis
VDDKQIRYIGEVGDEKGELYAGASALLMPIRWPEPFGLVMTEALACGTPVIAFPEGSASEIVLDGETGFVVEDEHAMADAIGRLGEIDRARCRESARERFDVTTVAESYEGAYERVI